jgi:hypothetical protein
MFKFLTTNNAITVIFLYLYFYFEIMANYANDYGKYDTYSLIHDKVAMICHDLP